MNTPREFSGLVGRIYDAILAPENWQEILHTVCGVIDAKAASINVSNPIDGQASMFVEYGTDPAWTALLLSTYARMSPIGAAILLVDLDEPIGAFDFIDEDEYTQSRFYKEWCAPQGYHDLIGAVIAKQPRSVGSLSATRGQEKGNFKADDRQFIGMVAPHVRRAVTISGLLEGRRLEHNALVGVIDQIATAMVLVDRNGRVVRLNPACEQLQAEGIVRISKDGLLGLPGPEANKALSKALEGNLSAPVLIPLMEPGGARLIAAVLKAEPSAGLFAVLINRQDNELPAFGKHLAQLFGLTPREVAVLMPLLEGKTIEETAGVLGVAEATARSHLKRLFIKTGTNRQTELVQIVMRALPPVRLSGGPST